MVSRCDIDAWKLVLISTLLSMCCYAQERDIRLYGGRGSYEGRVEVRVNGLWGTVCNDTWDFQDASVLCRELDNRTAIKHDVMYGEGVGSILYSNVMCSGKEQRLQDCSKIDSSGDVCQHSQDAGVQCAVKEFDLRLSGGSAPNEGRVEVYYNGNWGRVCAGSSWEKREADVVCRIVGYPNLAQEPRGSFGIGNGAVFLVDLTCTGTENTVQGCSSSVAGPNVPQSCPPGEEDATVICNPTLEVASEQLSTGAIAGISVGFGLVIVICCIFSLNCKCKDCCRKSELDDTDVYQCNTASNADSKVFSTTSNLKSESDNRNDSISDIDPNMFVFAPKVPPAGFGTSSGTSGTNGMLGNIDETKEPERELTESDKRDVPSTPVYHTIGEEQKTTVGDDVTVTTDENNHVYDYVKDPDNDKNDSETVTIDLQGAALFEKKNDEHGNPEHVENDYLEFEDVDDSFQNGDVVGKENESVSMEQQKEEDINISMTNEDTPLESRDESEKLHVDDQGNSERVENNYLELEDIGDSFQNEDVGKENDSGGLSNEQQGEHVNISMTNEDTPHESRDESEKLHLDDQGDPVHVENDYLELEDIGDSFQSGNVIEKENEGVSMEQQEERVNISMMNEDTSLESRDESHDDGLTSLSEGAEPDTNVDVFDTRL